MEVLEPVGLREKVKNTVIEISKNYKGGEFGGK
jgi:hypothetical protein